ncbi:XLF-domain-containing protein [Biscogniauxia marginata]|nr:XLF-domain-containing protein [Biscogniauxia marginata]
MASISEWYPLPAFPNLPALLVSPRFESSSYTIHITDLANVWVESLDRKAILLRSLQDNTSIDLSDGDPEQWAVFLSKLKAAFDPTSPDHHLGSLSLSASPNSISQDGLTLYVTCILPEPLEPLQWIMHLTKCPLTSVASELVLPLIQTYHAMTQDVQDLVHRLREKDAVIAKLIDKLEVMSMGLEHVFNSLSGKRKITRAVAEEKIKGLAPFNEDDWRLQKGAVRESPQDVASLIQGVFRHSGLKCDAKMETSASNQLSDWWTKLGPDSSSAIKPRAYDSLKKPSEAPMLEANSAEEGDEDEFQIQATPPHLQHARKKLNHAKLKKDASDDDDGSQTRIPNSYPAPAPEKPRAQIGAIGGRKNNTSSTNAVSQSSRTIPLDEDETASESDHDLEQDGDETASSSGSDNDEPPKPQSPQMLAPAQQKKGGLGRIGGKLRTTTAPSDNQNAKEPGTGSSTNESPAKPAGRKLGAVGNKAGADAKISSSPKAVEPEELENEEQRASRKRAELARELERKATAPVKKKRKF